MKRSIARARQKQALEAVETYETRIADLEKQVKKLNGIVLKKKPAKSKAQGGLDGDN